MRAAYRKKARARDTPRVFAAGVGLQPHLGTLLSLSSSVRFVIYLNISIMRGVKVIANSLLHHAIGLQDRADIEHSGANIPLRQFEILTQIAKLIAHLLKPF